MKIAILIASLLLVTVALSAPAQAEGPDRCPKGKVVWKLEKRRSCAAAPKPGVASNRDALPGLALPAWVRDAARTVPGRRPLAPPRVMRAVPKVARQAGRLATRAMTRARRRAGASSRGRMLGTAEVAERQEVGGGVFSEQSARMRLFEHDGFDLSARTEIRDRSSGAGVLFRPHADWAGEQPVGCPTSDGIVEATQRFRMGGTVMAMRGNAVLAARTNKAEFVARARGRVGTDARLERVSTELTMSTEQFERGLQIETTLRSEVRWERGGQPTVAGSPSVDVRVRAAGVSRAEEQAAEARYARQYARAPQVTEGIPMLAELVRRRLLDAEPNWYEPNNACADVRVAPNSETLEPGGQVPVTAEAVSRADGRVAEGVSTVTDVGPGTFETVQATSAPGAPARFVGTAANPNEWGSTLHASVVTTSRAGRVLWAWRSTAGGRPVDPGEVKLPQRYTGTLSANWTATGRAVDWTGTGTFARDYVTRFPDGTLYAVYKLTGGSLTSASDAINPGCGWVATGSGGEIEAGDVELRVRPDGSAQYALLFDMRIANATFQPSGCPLEPFTGDISARLNSRRPGPPDGQLRPADPDLGLRAQGVTDLTPPAAEATITGSWSLAPS
jgi:hypothetical protein